MPHENHEGPQQLENRFGWFPPKVDVCVNLNVNIGSPEILALLKGLDAKFTKILAQNKDLKQVDDVADVLAAKTGELNAAVAATDPAAP